MERLNDALDRARADPLTSPATAPGLTVNGATQIEAYRTTRAYIRQEYAAWRR